MLVSLSWSEAGMSDTQAHEHDPVILVDKPNVSVGRLGLIAVIMALVTSTIALITVAFDNRRLENDLNCLRETRLVVDVAVAAELASLGEASALIMEGLVASQTGDDERFAAVLEDAEAVIVEMKESAANLNSAVEGRDAALKACT